MMFSLLIDLMMLKVFFLLFLGAWNIHRVQCFSSSGVPCYLHPAKNKCHYTLQLDSVACTSPKTRERLDHGVKQLNKSINSLEHELIMRGVIPPDNTCSELPAVDNGSVVYSDLNLPPGCVGKYICDEGYFLRAFNGQSAFKCMEDGIWDGNVTSSLIECVLQIDRCIKPGEIDNGNITISKDILLPGDMIVYTCKEGYELSGKERRYCLRSGNWSEEQPKCLEMKAGTNVHQQAINNWGLIAGVSVTSVMLLLVILIITGVVVVIAIRRWKQHTENLVVNSLTVSNEDLSPSYQVMSSEYTGSCEERNSY